MVRLAAGVEENGRIDKDVAARALACLERFGQRLRDMHADSVRVVGTNALRRAHRKQAFLERAREALGHPIEIIAGMEEARLIYSGVAHTMPSEPGRRLVVDIGGGSTELIIGEGTDAAGAREPADGLRQPERALLPRRQDLGQALRARAARRAAGARAGAGGVPAPRLGDTRRQLRHRARYRRCDPRARSAGAHHHARRALQRAVDYCVEAGHTRELTLEPITEDRRPVFPGGLAILAEVFSVLEIKEMRIAEGAMREGLLYDMLGRSTARMRASAPCAPCSSATTWTSTQAERVEATVRDFLEQTRESLEARASRSRTWR